MLTEGIFLNDGKMGRERTKDGKMALGCERTRRWEDGVGSRTKEDGVRAQTQRVGKMALGPRVYGSW